MVTRYLLFLKYACKQGSLWITMLLLAALAMLLSAVALPDESGRTVLLWGSDGAARQLIAELETSDSFFRFREAPGEESVRAAVRSGGAECGFLFDPKLGERLAEGDTRDCITFVSSPFTVRGVAARETVFAALLRAYSEDLLRREASTIFADAGEGMTETMRLYEQYLGGERVFSAIYETIPAEAARETDGAPATYPVHGGVSLLLFLYLLFAEMDNRFGRGRRFALWLSARRRTGVFALKDIALLTIPGAAAFVLIRVLEPVGPLWTELLKWIAFLALALVWSMVFARLFRREEGMICWALLIFLVSLVLTPIVWNAESFLSVLAYPAYLIPNGWYLRLLG